MRLEYFMHMLIKAQKAGYEIDLKGAMITITHPDIEWSTDVKTMKPEPGSGEYYEHVGQFIEAHMKHPDGVVPAGYVFEAK
jgi:hypothetical protein